MINIVQIYAVIPLSVPVLSSVPIFIIQVMVIYVHTIT